MCVCVCVYETVSIVRRCVCSSREYASILNQIESSVHALNCNIHLLLKLSIFWMFIFYTRTWIVAARLIFTFLESNLSWRWRDERMSFLTRRCTQGPFSGNGNVNPRLNCYVSILLRGAEMLQVWPQSGLATHFNWALPSPVTCYITPCALFAYRPTAMSPVENTKKVLLSSTGNNTAARLSRMLQQRTTGWN